MWSAGYSALLCVPHSFGPLQTLDTVLDRVWPSLADIRCLPCGLAPGQHLSQITPTLSFLSGVSGAALCWLLWSSLPSENLPRGSVATIHKVPCGSVVFVLNSLRDKVVKWHFMEEFHWEFKIDTSLCLKRHLKEWMMSLLVWNICCLNFTQLSVLFVSFPPLYPPSP